MHIKCQGLIIDCDSDSVVPVGSAKDWKLKMVLVQKFVLIVGCKFVLSNGTNLPVLLRFFGVVVHL
jgi:hypothetical protein